MYITGLSKSTSPTNQEVEKILDKRYNLSGNNSESLMWAGPGTALIKRDGYGCCRGFAFLSFYSSEGASIAIDRINNFHNAEADDDKEDDGSSVPLSLRAELSSGGCKGKRNNGKSDNTLPDLRLRRQRKAPVRKHPVILSSDGKRTNLGSKNR